MAELLFEFRPIDVINAVVLAAVISLCFGIGLTRYFNFSLQIERAVVCAQKLFPLYHPNSREGANDLIAEVHTEFAAIALTLRASGHTTASSEIVHLWQNYRELLIRGLHQADRLGDTARTREWFAEMITNFAIHLFRLRPNWLMLFTLKGHYADADLTPDCERKDWQGRMPPQEPPTI